MQLKPEQLSRHLQQSLAPLYFISGDEPLLVQEAAAEITQSAQSNGYLDRKTFDVDNRFDWQTLRYETESLSLFCDKQILEIRLTGKLAKEGHGFLSEFAASPAADTLIIVRSGKIERATQNSKWFKAVEQGGVSVQVWPVERSRLPRWIEIRCAEKGSRLDAEGVQFLAEHVQGNLLAANQEIEKLCLLFPDSPRIDHQDVVASVMDSSRYNVFDLIDAALATETQRVQTVLSGLRQEGTDATIILWALSREIRMLWRLLGHINSGSNTADAFRQERVFQKRQGLVGGALKRLQTDGLQTLLQTAGDIDRGIKGQAKLDVWSGLLDLSLGLAGKTIIWEHNT